jgi:hypothetical protein
MATLKTRSSTQVSREVSITAEEVRAMIREKYPIIPNDATVSAGVSNITDELEAIRLRWMDKTTDSDEDELEPAGPRCERPCSRLCGATQNSRLVQIADGEANE